MLREQFLENVRSVHLRWDLNRRVEQDPDMPFLAIRKVALSWANDVDSEAPVATKKRVRVSSQEAVTEGMAAEISLKEIVQGLAASQKVLTENVVLLQATTNQLMKQQGELLQAMAPTSMRREHYNGNNQPSNDECYYCHRRGHFKRACAALKRAQRDSAELASIARRRRGKRRGDTGAVKSRKMVANEVDSACLKQQQQTCLKHSSRESSSEAIKPTFAKQRARLLAEHANAMLVRDRVLDTLEEKCRGLTQQLKAALDTHVMNSAIYDDKTELENVIKLSAKEKLQMGMKQVECDALKQTIEDGDKKHGLLEETLNRTTNADAVTHPRWHACI